MRRGRDAAGRPDKKNMATGLKAAARATAGTSRPLHSLCPYSQERANQTQQQRHTHQQGEAVAAAALYALSLSTLGSNAGSRFNRNN